MSIFSNIFGGQAPAGANQNPTVPGNTVAANNPNNPNPPAIPLPGEGDKSPLEQFSKLWETPATPGVNPSFAPEFTFNQSKVGEAAAKMDFRKVVDPAKVQKAIGGDANAFMEVLNTMQQATWAQAVTASGMMSQEAAKRTGDATKAALPEFLRRNQAAEATRENTFFADPAVAPLMQSLQTQLAVQYPNASSAELQSYTQKYFEGLATGYMESTGKQITTPTKQAASRGGDDWSTFLPEPSF